MTRYLYALSACATTAAAGTALAGTTNFFANLSGNNEVPAISTTATGTATAVYDDIANTLSVQWDIMGLMGNPASPGSHIHNGAPDENGPVVFPFHNPDGTWPLAGSAVWTDVPSGMVDALFAGGLYFNFHTDMFPGGEVRGQIVPAPAAAGLFGIAGLVSARRRR
ncbi:MAG: CHRD domain-containing protein [Phycisphaerales bacterium]|nr:CHRD domain-containing protein [Phycisphaerales bacterium]